MTTSDKVREEGNAFFRKASKDGLAPTLVAHNMEKALSAYLQAEHTAETGDQRASAQKNYAKACFKWAATQLHTEGDQLRNAKFYLKQGFLYVSKARETGTGKPISWHQDLEGSAKYWFHFVKNFWDRRWGNRKAISHLEEIAPALPKGVVRGTCFLEIGKELLSQGMEDTEKDNFKSGLSLSRQCHYYVEESDSNLRDDLDLKEDVRNLREEVDGLMRISESVQARVTGDDLLDKLLEEDSPDFSLTLHILDWYNQAVILTREKQVECEAAALSRIGHLYGRVLKMVPRAKQFYTQCIMLATSGSGRSPEGKDWFEDAKNFLKQCQRDEEEQASNKWENIPEERIEDIKADISKIEEMSAGSIEELLSYIYNTHPPKDPSKKMYEGQTPWDTDTSSKAIMKALYDYSPSKASGAEWKVLCQDITSILNKVYARKIKKMDVDD